MLLLIFMTLSFTPTGGSAALKSINSAHRRLRISRLDIPRTTRPRRTNLPTYPTYPGANSRVHFQQLPRRPSTKIAPPVATAPQPLFMNTLPTPAVPFARRDRRCIQRIHQQSRAAHHFGKRGRADAIRWGARRCRCWRAEGLRLMDGLTVPDRRDVTGYVWTGELNGCTATALRFSIRRCSKLGCRLLEALSLVRRRFASDTSSLPKWWAARDCWWIRWMQRRRGGDGRLESGECHERAAGCGSRTGAPIFVGGVGREAAGSVRGCGT